MRAWGIAALLGLAATLGLPAPAKAAEPENCRTVRMADPGWMDITATNAVAGKILDALGYQQKVETVAVPIIFQGLKTGKVDVFLGNWVPAQTPYLEPLLKEGSAELVRANLEGAKFTLAVPRYVAEAGVRSFADLSRFPDRFESKIYGIESGAPANQNIQRMLSKGDFGLAGWTLVESSEQAMLAQAKRRARTKDWIVFLAWQPHPMNTAIEISYLSGGDEYFGPDYGGATVNTLTRRGYGAECPNVRRLFERLAYTVDMENEIMRSISDEKRSPQDAATAYLKAHPELIGPWLDGVTTRDGGDGPAAVRAALGVN